MASLVILTLGKGQAGLSVAIGLSAPIRSGTCGTDEARIDIFFAGAFVVDRGTL